MGLSSIMGKLAPFAKLIPGYGTAISAGLGVGSSLLKGKEQKKAQAGNAAIQAANQAEYEKRYNNNRLDSQEELARMIAENNDINADMETQRGAYNDDIRSSRAGASKTVEDLLNEVRNGGVDIKDVADIQEFDGGPDATYQDQAYVEDNSDAAVLRDRAAARGMQGRDSVEAAQLQRQMMTEAGQEGPSANALSGLIAKAGGTAISRSFEDSGNKAAMELARTGGNNSDTYASLARERAEALKGNDTNAILAGMQGAEDMAGAKAQRLNPMIAALSARATASPDASAEMQGMAIRGQAKQANQSMNMQGRQNVQQMNMAQRAQNNQTNAGIRGANATNKITTQGQRVSQATAKSGQLAALAPAALTPYSMRMLAPEAKRASGGRDLRYQGTGVGQNEQVIQENNTGSGVLERLGGLADLAGRAKSSYNPATVKTPTAINAAGMLEKARSQRLANYKPATVSTPGKIDVKGMMNLYGARKDMNQ